eukprot:CAMPEP_0119117580 /NCGR_PEP_ID=MMETSP1180-20130426/52920_1 /TAXON_ID=3052 ORGANISM="Chlamydomonas cf sp, Strain CCMP681" /NCGR_SAMPLE_ID=MMETSP1180 /ASSEMBLY_ACC=CAM_ASM_000741 /LENGTH=43 /DNA_ID=CAMNT_0007106855 /DNA_START=857 /DNA_END=985 /DNA_ORIENTATION=+
MKQTPQQAHEKLVVVGAMGEEHAETALQRFLHTEFLCLDEAAH